MEREQFTFYQSFAKAVSRIKSKAARCDAYDVIVNYALYGIEPELDKVSDSAAMAFDLIKPNLDASRRKAENGKSGGQRKQTESKPQARKRMRKRTRKRARKRKRKRTNVIPRAKRFALMPKAEIPPLTLTGFTITSRQTLQSLGLMERDSP